ncbi:MAG: DNA-3-methyladenine glycosylase 2 family protein [Clostridiaceae bacterium]|nr:DNA-3-methyladenine glycosylase 2 family protein [Clostridiaceae bacterium]
MYRILSTANNNLHVQINDFNPFHTFLCGQCFRWNYDGEQIWTGVALGRLVRLKWDGEICIFFDMTEKEFIGKWVHYFDLDTDYSTIKEILSKKDEHLKKAVSFGYGIRLLRQDLWEVILSFIISQNNGIPRIKRIIETLSEHYGEKIPGESDKYAFPAPYAIARSTLQDLNICRGGYRCRYILSAAERLSNSPFLLDEMKKLPAEKTRELLLSFTGIGEKVADCILLYSGLDRNAFPIDRWVKRVIETLYFNKETDVNTIRAFSRDYFGELSGIAQQYLFYYARENRIGL